MSNLADLFRQNVKKILESRGRGAQASLAKALDASPTSVNNLLAAVGEIQSDTIEAYRVALGVSISELLADDPSHKKPTTEEVIRTALAYQNAPIEVREAVLTLLEYTSEDIERARPLFAALRSKQESKAE